MKRVALSWDSQHRSDPMIHVLSIAIACTHQVLMSTSVNFSFQVDQMRRLGASADWSRELGTQC